MRPVPDRHYRRQRHRDPGGQSRRAPGRLAPHRGRHRGRRGRGRRRDRLHRRLVRLCRLSGRTASRLREPGPRANRSPARTGPLKEMITVGKIGVHEFITLDGVIGDPSWSFDYSFGPEMGAAIGEIMGSSTAILLGRRTYQEFAPSWSTRSAEEDPGAPFMNGAPKYVVSGTLQTAEWNNSTILGPYNPDTIRELKDRF